MHVNLDKTSKLDNGSTNMRNKYFYAQSIEYR